MPRRLFLGRRFIHWNVSSASRLLAAGSGDANSIAEPLALKSLRHGCNTKYGVIKTIGLEWTVNAPTVAERHLHPTWI